MIGSLMYLMNMRPNISFAVNTLSQYLIDPRHVHLTTAKHILRYLKGTIDYGIKYDVNQNISMHGYVDSDWEGSATNRKSSSCCCFSLGYGMISWYTGYLDVIKPVGCPSVNNIPIVVCRLLGRN